MTINTFRWTALVLVYIASERSGDVFCSGDVNRDLEGLDQLDLQEAPPHQHLESNTSLAGPPVLLLRLFIKDDLVPVFDDSTRVDLLMVMNCWLLRYQGASKVHPGGVSLRPNPTLHLDHPRIIVSWAVLVDTAFLEYDTFLDEILVVVSKLYTRSSRAARRDDPTQPQAARVVRKPYFDIKTGLSSLPSPASELEEEEDTKLAAACLCVATTVTSDDHPSQQPFSELANRPEESRVRPGVNHGLGTTHTNESSGRVYTCTNSTVAGAPGRGRCRYLMKDAALVRVPVVNACVRRPDRLKSLNNAAGDPIKYLHSDWLLPLTLHIFYLAR